MLLFVVLAVSTCVSAHFCIRAYEKSRAGGRRVHRGIDPAFIAESIHGEELTSRQRAVRRIVIAHIGALLFVFAICAMSIMLISRHVSASEATDQNTAIENAAHAVASGAGSARKAWNFG